MTSVTVPLYLGVGSPSKMCEVASLTLRGDQNGKVIMSDVSALFRALADELDALSGRCGAVEEAPETRCDRARLAYHAYGDSTGWKNFRGDPMPGWQDLPEATRQAWEAAAQAAARVPASCTPPQAGS